MATENPYDRRDRSRARHARDGRDGPAWSAPAVFVTEDRGLAFEDIEALARSAHARGRIQGLADTRVEHGEALVASRRVAWNEGHAAGVKDGQVDLLRTIDEQFGDAARQRIADIDTLLAYAADHKVPRGDVKRELAAARDLLSDLVDAHHAGFAPELPF